MEAGLVEGEKWKQSLQRPQGISKNALSLELFQIKEQGPEVYILSLTSDRGYL